VKISGSSFLGLLTLGLIGHIIVSKITSTRLNPMSSNTRAGATKIMVIRHAEKPDNYNGQMHYGVDSTGSVCGSSAAEHLVTLGWERAGGLVSLFSGPLGPGKGLSTPQFLYAANPDNQKPVSQQDAGKGDEGPSQRPYETLNALAWKLALKINTDFSKKHYEKMLQDAIQQNGIVLICWQHEDIPLRNAQCDPGISQCILTMTGTNNTMGVPSTWPKAGAHSRYDLVFVFDRPKGKGPIESFSVIPQLLLAGDSGWPLEV
jgi:hypothetical protein